MQFPKTHGQCVYVRHIQANKPILIATGPAGSGKTLLVCQEAVRMIRSRQVGKIIFTRPIVAADEDMGYLPGEMERKMEPWDKPMMEIMENYLTHNQINARTYIEPLGFMRGRTFTNSFIIADEMQNSTPNQMKMLLTRVGENTKLVVTGDTSQSDLGQENGLMDIINKINGLEYDYVSHMEMDNDDVMRHPAVSEILSVYNK
jgi:phosphate starvation-inducible protein PhoH and related proteins